MGTSLLPPPGLNPSVDLLTGFNVYGLIPRGLPRIRHTGGSRYPDKHRTGCRIKSGMTKDSQYPAACGAVVYSGTLPPSSENLSV
jgi:hypothetical protein